jgi:hypothetical protein
MTVKLWMVIIWVATLKMEVAGSLKILVGMYMSSWFYNPDNHSLNFVFVIDCFNFPLILYFCYSVNFLHLRAMSSVFIQSILCCIVSLNSRKRLMWEGTCAV